MKEEIHDARCEIEWVEEHLECVGGIHKQLYIDALERVDKLLEKIENAMKVLSE